jgi:predicted N-acetyltransferase YhbS
VTRPQFRTPRPLRAGDKLSEFHSGEDSLDTWLRGYARGNEKAGASRTLVSVTDDESRVAGYYCISSSSLKREESRTELGKGMPSSVPLVVLGRLAVDREFQGMGLGISLLQHATVRALEAADILGIRAILVHALTDDVVPFYERFGFTSFPGAKRSLYLLTADARSTLRSH